MQQPMRRVVERIYMLFWLVFLLSPLLCIWLVPIVHSLPLQLLATVTTVAFGVCYAIYLLRNFDDGVRSASVRELLRQVVVLMLLAGCTAPVLGGYTISFTPYLLALLVYARPVREALLWFAAILGFSLVLYLATQINIWGFLGPTISNVFILLGRVQMHMEERAAADHEKAVVARERELIARNIHDILGHSLTVLALKTQVAQQYLAVDQARTAAELDGISRLTQQALSQVRSAAYQLGNLDLESQVAAATAALEDAEITVHRAGSWGSWQPEQRAFVAWLVREAVTNVLRHSAATSCWLSFGERQAQVRDNGNGFNVAVQGFGLSGLQARALESGYDLSVSSDSDGTAVTVQW